MKSNIYTLVIFFATVFAIASCNNDTWDSMPDAVTNFFTTYFPGQEVNSYSETSTGSVASVKGGVTVTFDSAEKWTEVNGNGSILPSIFLYDQLPTKLYNYLLETEATEGVYKVSRTSVEYMVQLHDSSLTYTIATQTVTVNS